MTNDDHFDIYCPTTLRAVMRMWYGERRVQNVQRVRQTVRAAAGYASRSLEEANALLAHAREGGLAQDLRVRIDTTALQHLRMSDALWRARDGLGNLRQTYRDDAALVSQLQRLIEEVDDFRRVMAPHTASLRARCPNVAAAGSNADAPPPSAPPSLLTHSPVSTSSSTASPAHPPSPLGLSSPRTRPSWCQNARRTRR